MVNAYMFLYVFVWFGTPAPGTTLKLFHAVSRLHLHAFSKGNLHKWKWKKHQHDSIDQCYFVQVFFFLSLLVFFVLFLSLLFFS